MRHRCVSGIAALALVVAACTAAPAGLTPEDEAAIRAVVDRYSDDWAANRIAESLDVFAEDAVEVISTARIGKTAIRERWQAFIDRYVYETVNTNVEEIVGRGDLAYIWLSFEHTHLYNGNPMEGHGNMLWILRKQEDGGWLVSHSAGSSTQSARADTTASF